MSMDGASGMPSNRSRPNVDVYPTTPQYAAGTMIDWSVCDPIAKRQIPAATAAADPPLDPPGVRRGSRGFTVGGGSQYANSSSSVFPSTTAPAPLSRVTTSDSSPSKTSGGSRDPAAVGRPSTR